MQDPAEGHCRKEDQPKRDLAPGDGDGSQLQAAVYQARNGPSPQDRR